MKLNTFSIVLIYFVLLTIIDKTRTLADPFTILGIPSLNLSQIFKNENKIFKQENSPNNDQIKIRINSIDDLPKFIKQTNLNKEEGSVIISKFLLADDYILKKSGAVFDQTGFDGLAKMEEVSPIGSKNRIMQRSKSAAKIYSDLNNTNKSFEPYAAEVISQTMPKGWSIFKVLLIGQNNSHLFLKVCLPDDETLVPIVSDIKSECHDKVNILTKIRLNLLKRQKLKIFHI